MRCFEARVTSQSSSRRDAWQPLIDGSRREAPGALEPDRGGVLVPLCVIDTREAEGVTALVGLANLTGVPAAVVAQAPH